MKNRNRSFYDMREIFLKCIIKNYTRRNSDAEFHLNSKVLNQKSVYPTSEVSNLSINEISGLNPPIKENYSFLNLQKRTGSLDYNYAHYLNPNGEEALLNYSTLQKHGSNTNSTGA